MLRALAVLVVALVAGATPAGATPSNDDFAAAVEAAPLPFVATADTRGATTETGEPTPSCAPSSATVWYRVTAGAPARLELHTFGSKFDTVLAVYRGTSLGDLTEVGCNDDVLEPGSQQSQLNVGVVAGEYFIQVGGYEGAAGYMKLTVATGLNDDFDEALEIGALPFTHEADTNDATLEPGEPQECAPQGSTLWYRVTLPAGGGVTVNTAGSDYDTVLTAFTGSAFSNLVVVDCNDDTQTGLQAQIAFTASPGVTYHIQAGGFAGSIGHLVLNIAASGGGPQPGPAHNAFASAVEINDVPFSDRGVDTTEATLEAGEPVPSCAEVGATVWYKITLPEDRVLLLDTTGSNYDTVIAVYTGDSLATLQEEPLPFGCNDDVVVATVTASVLTMEASGGVTYFIQVGGFGDASGSLEFFVTPVP